MPCSNQNIVSAATFSAANSFRRNSLRGCVRLTSWSHRRRTHPTLMHVRPDYVPELNRHALDEMERYKSSCLRFLLPVGISAVSLILSLIALFE